MDHHGTPLIKQLVLLLCVVVVTGECIRHRTAVVRSKLESLVFLGDGAVWLLLPLQNMFDPPVIVGGAAAAGADGGGARRLDRGVLGRLALVTEHPPTLPHPTAPTPKVSPPAPSNGLRPPPPVPCGEGRKRCVTAAVVLLG